MALSRSSGLQGTIKQLFEKMHSSQVCSTLNRHVDTAVYIHSLRVGGDTTSVNKYTNDIIDTFSTFGNIEIPNTSDSSYLKNDDIVSVTSSCKEPYEYRDTYVNLEVTNNYRVKKNPNGSVVFVPDVSSEHAFKTWISSS